MSAIKAVDVIQLGDLPMFLATKVLGSEDIVFLNENIRNSGNNRLPLTVSRVDEEGVLSIVSRGYVKTKEKYFPVRV